MKVGRQLRVLFLGYPNFIYMLAPVLSTKDVQFRPFEGKKRLAWVLPVIWSDVCYFIGGRYSNNHILTLCRLLNKPVVMHWVGTDVIEAIEAFNTQGGLPRKVVGSCIHWVELNWTAKELSSIKISAEIVPLPVMLSTESVSPLPQIFTILAYLPAVRPTFYGAHHILRLAKEMPDIRFMCVGSKDSPFHFTSETLPTNIKLLGRPESLEKVYPASTVLVRVTEHDGLSFMALEALSHGRYLIWSYPLEGAHGALVASDYEAMYGHVQALYEKHVQGSLLPNYEGVEFVRSHYDPARIAKDIRRRFRSLLTGK